MNKMLKPKIIKKKREITQEHVERLKRARESASGKKLNPRERWEKKPTSLRVSVNAKCYECCGEEGYIRRIRYCQIFDCPLWYVRPYSKGISKEECTDYNEAPPNMFNEDDE